MKIYKNTTVSARSLLLSLLISCGLIALSIALMTALCYATEDPLGNTRLFSLICVILSGAVCGFVNAKRKSGGVALSVLSALSLSAVMIIISTFMSDSSTPATAMNALCYALTASGAAFIGKPRAKKHKRRI